MKELVHAQKTVFLPTKPKPVEKDIRKYSFLLYGREGIGKTTWLSSFPGILFFAFEPGTKGLSVYEYAYEIGGVKDWNTFLEGIKQLETKQHSFEYVAIDTIDRAYDACSEWICRKLGIPRLGVSSSGEGDYGVSYREANKEFLNALTRILRAGLGLYMTSHCKEITIRSRSGMSFDRVCPSLPDSARRVVEAFVDFIFFADYLSGVDNSGLKRVLITQGDELIVAKQRLPLPKYIELTKEGGYTLLQKALSGEYKGIDPTILRPSPHSSDATAQTVVQDRVKKSKAKVLDDESERRKEVT